MLTRPRLRFWAIGRKHRTIIRVVADTFLRLLEF